MPVSLKDRIALQCIRNYRGVSTRLTASAIDRLDTIAKANDSTLSAVLRVAIEQFIEELDKNPELDAQLTTKRKASKSAEAQ